MEADYPHTNADEGDHDHQGEKKSMLRRVKDKAKKIKDTIRNHGNDHEEEDVEDEEEETAPRFISGTDLPKQTGLDLEKPAVPQEEVYPVKHEATETTGVHDYGETGGLAEGKHDRSLRKEVYGSKNSGVREMESNTRDEFRPEDRMPDLQDNSHKRDEVNTGIADEVTRTSGPGKFDDPQVQHHFPDSNELKEASAVKSEPQEDLVEDPHRPGDIAPSNYQTKAVHPTNLEGEYDRSLRDEGYGSKSSGVREMPDSSTRDEFHPEDRTPDLQDNSHKREEAYTGVADEVNRTSGPGKFDDPQVHHFPDSMELKETSAVKSGPLEDLVQDPHRPGAISPSNYQTKAADPTNLGGKEADVSPLIQQLDNLHVGDEQSSYTGSRDQSALECNPDAIPLSKNPETSDPARPESMPQDTIPGKISWATSAVAGTAVSAKNAVASKLGYGDSGVAAVAGGGGESDKGASVKEYKEASPVKTGPVEHLVEDPNRPGDISPGNYQSKAIDPTNQGGKEADVSPLVQRLDNLHVGDEQSPCTGSHDQFAPAFNPDAVSPSKNPKTLDPAGPESVPQDTITGRISSATSAMAGTAVSAKNAVASKLGYGDTGVASVDGGGGESNKGAPVKESWSEKLSPGEEDRALSEAITDGIQKRKGNKSEEESSENPGVVGRVKGAVSSWLGMSGGTPTVDQDRPECRSGLVEGGVDKQK